MPIRPELRPYYPSDWARISAEVRARAGNRCERCDRPHLGFVLQLADGRWLDEANGTWRDDRGKAAAPPDLVDYAAATRKRVRVAAAHINHRPWDRTQLAAWCGRCHLNHDRPMHLAMRRLARVARLWLGDLLEGPYPTVLGMLEADDRRADLWGPSAPPAPPASSALRAATVASTAGRPRPPRPRPVRVAPSPRFWRPQQLQFGGAIAA